MLPIAAAFQKCEKDGIIAISAVSGASAGSICAALIAGNADIDAVVSFVKSEGESYAKKLISEDIRRLSRFLKKGIAGKIISLPKNSSFLSEIALSGRSALDKNLFEDFIRKLLSSMQYKNIEDTDITLYINASNIVNSTSHTFNGGVIERAVIDSCSIPFVFRSFGDLNKSHVVDGGLCENLPTDILLKRGRDPIFAIFPNTSEETSDINNILTYSLSLFSASMNHNIHRSKERISKAFSLPVDCDYGTFDFSKAVNRLKEDTWYQYTFEKYVRYIEDFAKSYGFLASQKQSRSVDVNDIKDYIDSLELLTQDYSIYFEYEVGKFEVFVHCDRNVGSKTSDIEQRPADTVVKTATIKAIKPGLRYFRTFIGVDSTTGEARPTIWSAKNITQGQELDITVLSLGKMGPGDAGKHCVVLFNDADKAIAVGDQIEIVDSYHVKGGMIGMNRKQNEFIGIQHNHTLKVDRIELIIHYPAKLGVFEIYTHPTKNQVTSENIYSPVTTVNGFSKIGGIDMRTLILCAKNVEEHVRFYGIANYISEYSA